MRIGFIGLGIMGKPMCRNLLAAGHDLTVSSYNPTAADELAEQGAEVVTTPRDVAAAVDLVITMLPNGPQVRDVVLGADGILDGAHEGLVYVDMSSIAPGVAREVHDRLGAAGVPMLDAPVSGGEPKAIDGTLSIMAGGDASRLRARARGPGRPGVLRDPRRAHRCGKHDEARQPGRRRPEHRGGGRGPRPGPPGGSRAGVRVRRHPRGSRREHRPRREGADDARPGLHARASASSCTPRTSPTPWTPRRRSTRHFPSPARCSR